jgi:hypothetical protein
MNHNKLIKIYSGTDISVRALKDRLEKAGISTSIHNDSNDSALGGFAIAIDLYIRDSDLKRAKKILDDFPGK